MSFRVTLPPTFSQRLKDLQDTAAQSASAIGLFVCSGSDTNAEIAAAAGFDWLLIDGEHSPYTLETVVSLLRTVAAYPTIPVVRIPANDTVLIKQYLDTGAQNLMVPMVHTREQAEQAVAAIHYPPRGMRGIGSALARSSRFGAVDGYLQHASELVSLTVQIESGQAVDNAEAIASVDGVDAVFIGPADLAASMGYLGDQQHPEVLAAVQSAFDAVKRAGKPVGINAFNQEQAKQYVESGADFVCVGADVQQLAVAARGLVHKFKEV